MVIGTTNNHQAAIEPRLIAAGWQEIPACGFTNNRTKSKIKFWRKFLIPECATLQQ